MRIGRLRLEGDPGAWDMPALAPLLGQSHVLIEARGDAGRAAAGQALLQSVLLRLVLTCPPRRVQLTLCEPGGTGSLLAGFLHLPPEQRGPRVFVRPDELSAQLAQISEHITYVAQEQLRNVYTTVEEYNAANPATAVPYRVLVIAGLPAGCDERTWAALLQVARTGPASGVYVLATLDSLTPPARNINPDDLLALCTPLRLSAPDCLLWRDAELGEFAVTPDAPPPAAQMNAWLTTAGAGLARTASLSTNASKDFNIAAVRALLNDALTDDDLDSLCLDHFKPVHDQFSAGMARTEKIRRLVNYADKKRLIPRLIRHVTTIAPAQVARWKARLTGAPQPR